MDKAEQELREAILEAQAEAALGGHDLGPFEPVEDQDGRPNGYEAECRLCKLTSWVGPQGLRYSLLESECPGEEPAINDR